MKTLASALLFLLLLAVPPAAAQLLDFYGFSYTDTGGDQDLCLAGEVDALFQPLFALPGYEYTIYIYGLAEALVEEQGGGWTRIVYEGGFFEIWEDNGTPFDYGVDPPNENAPATFRDGDFFLAGQFLSFEKYENATLGIGSFQGNVEFTGGSHLVDLGFASGWTFGGTTTNSLDMPEGYTETWDGMFYTNTTGTESTSWGKIKSLYR